jgi:hypothetical protein
VLQLKRKGDLRKNVLKPKKGLIMKKKVLFPPFLLLALFCGAFSFYGIDVLPQAGGGQTSGFLIGIWHGLVSPISLAVSLFSKQVHFFAGGGALYIIGFILGGVVLLFGGRVLSQKFY